MVTARDIYQANLDAATRALWTRDLALMLEHLALPTMMVTEDCEFVLSSALELEIAMNELCDHLGRLGVQECHRLCRQAAFVDGTGKTLRGRHATYLLREGVQVMPPYWSETTLLEINGRWQVTRLAASVCNKAFPFICEDMAKAQKAEISARLRATKD